MKDFSTIAITISQPVLVPVVELATPLEKSRFGSIAPSLLALSDANTDAGMALLVQQSRKAPSRPQFEGGLVLLSAQTVLSTPNCCACLSDMLSWREALTAPEDRWIEIMNGHPCLVARQHGSDILLSPNVEPGDSYIAPRPDEPVWRVSRLEFGTAMDGAEREMRIFKNLFLAWSRCRSDEDYCLSLIDDLMGWLD